MSEELQPNNQSNLKEDAVESETDEDYVDSDDEEGSAADIQNDEDSDEDLDSQSFDSCNRELDLEPILDNSVSKYSVEWLPKEQISSFCHAIETNSSITNLEFQTIDHTNIYAALKKKGNIHYLSIKTISIEDIEDCCDYIQSNSSLYGLQLGSMNHYCKRKILDSLSTKSLVYLILLGDLDEMTGESLANIITRSRNLIYLGLEQSNDTIPMKHIAPSITKSNLQSLTISQCQLESPDAEQLLSELSTIQTISFCNISYSLPEENIELIEPVLLNPFIEFFIFYDAWIHVSLEELDVDRFHQVLKMNKSTMLSETDLVEIEELRKRNAHVHLQNRKLCSLLVMITRKLILLATVTTHDTISNIFNLCCFDIEFYLDQRTLIEKTLLNRLCIGKIMSPFPFSFLELIRRCNQFDKSNGYDYDLVYGCLKDESSSFRIQSMLHHRIESML
ncbi:hypothetical protein HDV02_003104 [Globomyces sp. JEL0801]|nr:hypothetical protein HDV02_003104 [Globomyces sp. JEL0801]